MTGADEPIVRLLEEIRDAQREHLALYRQAVAQQAESMRVQADAVRMQAEAVGMQRAVVRRLIPVLVAAFFVVAAVLVLQAV